MIGDFGVEHFRHRRKVGLHNRRQLLENRDVIIGEVDIAPDILKILELLQAAPS
jgi:hypothetical protein